MQLNVYKIKYFFNKDEHFLQEKENNIKLSIF